MPKFAETPSRVISVEEHRGKLTLIATKEVYSIVSDDGTTLKLEPEKMVFQVGFRNLRDWKDFLKDP